MIVQKRLIRYSDWTFWEQRIREDPRFRQACRKEKTEELYGEIQGAVLGEDNNCIFCWGTKDSGKSESILALALYELYEKGEREGGIVEKILRETEWGFKYSVVTKSGKVYTLFVNFNLDATLKVTMQADEGDIIIQDEFTELMGLLSQTAMKKLYNILTTIRCTTVSFYFAHTEEMKIAGINFYLEAGFKDTENRENYLMWYNKKQKPIAIVVIPIHELATFRTLYKRKKDQFAFGLMAEGGRQYVIPEIEQDALKVVDYIRQKGFGKITLSLLNDIAIKLGIPTEAGHYKRVAREARLILEEEGGVGEQNVVSVEGYQGQTANLREAVLEQLERYADDPKKILFLREWIEKEKQRDIASRHDISQTMVSIGLKDVREKWLGYAFEDVYSKILGDGWIHGGKNTDEPDFIQEEQKKVISAKCYADKAKTVTIPFNDLAKKEVELLEKGWQLQLVFYNICWDERKIFTNIVRGDEAKFTFRKP